MINIIELRSCSLEMDFDADGDGIESNPQIAQIAIIISMEKMFKAGFNICRINRPWFAVGNAI